MQKLLTRRWKPGDVYAPHDLSSSEMRKWKLFGKPTMDAFDALAINPLDEYKVCEFFKNLRGGLMMVAE